MKKLLLCLILFLSPSALAKPVALVYNGDGVCAEDCATTFQNALPEYQVQYVTNATYSPGIFANANVWIEPGGYATNQMDGMPASLKNAIKSFVTNGGGYLGFCAGAFTATEYVGTTNTRGLNLIAGDTELWGTGLGIEKVLWSGTTRYIYWEGGPYFHDFPSSVSVVAYYPDGSPAAIRSTYGKGRVFLSGVHPEAPAYWKDGLTDPDGSDFDLVQSMAAWVTFQAN